MTFVRRRTSAGRAVAVVTSGLLAAGAVALCGAAPASAAEDTPPGHGGATAKLQGLRAHGEAVVRVDGQTRTTAAGLFEMAVDGGGTLQTYCLDIDNPTQEQARYQEVPWKASSLHDNRNAGRIRWIVQHSYPQVNDLQELARVAGTDRLTPETAAAGTQVAIWRYSDQVDVKAKDPAAEKLADHLERVARALPEPKASLQLDPPEVSGRSGSRLGPVTVRTNESSTSVTVAPDAAERGVRLVGKDGKPVDTARDGTALYFDVPEDAEDGTTSLTVQTSTKVPVGRVLTGFGEHAKSQTQILAGSSQSTVTATASARWAAEGPVPAVSARKNCARDGVDITVANGGEEPFRYSLAGKRHETAAGRSATVTVPVTEDRPYRISVTGSGGYTRTFTGVLDCATAASVGTASEAGMTPQSGPVASDDPYRGDTAGGASTDLAETGSGTNTPLIVGTAIGLVVVGGIAILAVRRRQPGTETGAAAGGSQE